jgi:hypothetical protein
MALSPAYRLKELPMTSDNDWIDLQISVLELGLQRARVRVRLMPPELIEAILREFRDTLAFLTDHQGDYELRVGHSGDALNDTIEIGHQVSSGVQIALVERSVPLPRLASPILQPAFICNLRTGGVTRLSWQPAIIGRPDPKRENNHLLAVDLTDEPSATRVSRHHLQLIAEREQYFVQQLVDNNPTVLIGAGDKRQSVGEMPLPIYHKDTIELTNSGIRLTFLQRTQTSA